MKITDVGRISKGVGGSYTKWQRKPPAHSVYRVKSSIGHFKVKVWAEQGVFDDEPSIAKIEQYQATHDGVELTEEQIREVSNYILGNVIPEEDFWSFNNGDSSEQD